MSAVRRDAGTSTPRMYKTHDISKHVRLNERKSGVHAADLERRWAGGRVWRRSLRRRAPGLNDTFREAKRAEVMAQLDARYRAPLRSFFRRRIEDSAEVEDLTQETFVRLLRSEQIDRLEKAETFVFRVAANLLRDHKRRRLVRGVSWSLSTQGESYDAIAQLIDDHAPERVLIERQELLQALRALDELPELSRRVFVLWRLEKMKKREIAALLGISVSTVDRRLEQAMFHLAKRCGEP